jgi:hypothetical protein
MTGLRDLTRDYSLFVWFLSTHCAPSVTGRQSLGYDISCGVEQSEARPES